MKKVSLLSFYLIATVAILSSGNDSLLKAKNAQNPSSHTEKAEAIGGETSQNPSNPPRP